MMPIFWEVGGGDVRQKRDVIGCRVAERGGWVTTVLDVQSLFLLLKKIEFAP